MAGKSLRRVHGGLADTCGAVIRRASDDALEADRPGRMARGEIAAAGEKSLQVLDVKIILKDGPGSIVPPRPRLAAASSGCERWIRQRRYVSP
jgi:hypothetical protein